MRYLIFIAVIFITSCVHNPPTIIPQMRCTSSYEFDYGSIEEKDAFFENIDDYKNNPELRKKFLRDVLKIFGTGYCHKYDVKNVRRVSDVHEVPLIDLEDFTGFSLNSWGEYITPFGKESKRYSQRWCK